MDFFDEKILASLKDGKPKDFKGILDQVGFSHNTLQQHLRGLVDRGLIFKQKPTLKTTGRPKFTYQIPSTTAKQLKIVRNDANVELVGIAFSRLRHVCRFEKGGICKLTRNMCSPQICPEIKK
jgi:predicted ArsR family transcriptional regulator